MHRLVGLILLLTCLAALPARTTALDFGDYHALVIGIDTDVLYPLAEQRELVDHLPNARLAILEASHGHDAFLIELETMNDLVRSWRMVTIDPHVLVSA